jgi:hypothetical protein
MTATLTHIGDHMPGPPPRGHLEIPSTRSGYAGRFHVYLYEEVFGGLSVALFAHTPGTLLDIKFIDPRGILR